MTIEITRCGKQVYLDNLKTSNSNKTEVKNENFSNILNSKLTNTNSESLDKIFQRAGEMYNVPVNLLKSVAKAESSFNHTAVSSAGAEGIMQLMPDTAKGLGVTNSFDPEQNIMGGAKYLSQMLDRFDGNVELSLAAYNAGPGNVIKYEGIPPFKETQNYVSRVMGYCGLDADSLNAGYANIGTLNTNTYNSNILNSSIYSDNQPDELMQVLQGTDISDVLNNSDLDSEDYELMINLYRYKAQLSMLDNNMDFNSI
ncbi:MAG: lytic transglycosylase domain-containing protein [Sedimentibacter sp.]